MTAALAAALLFAAACPAAAQEAPPAVDPLGMTVATRFPPPAGFARIPAGRDSFAAFLRQLPLKPPGSPVRLYDGRLKPNPGIYAAVIDLPIGQRDLQQCADAIMRLRADYLFSQKRYDEIRFRFSNGFLAEYSRWRRGGRIAVSGNAARWVATGRPGDDRASYWSFLETVFSYAGTASLSRELLAAGGNEPEIGEIFIQPGHPGHAVIVIDAARRRSGGGMLFLLAQSYMPAQEIQVLQNPGDPRLSPWYPADFGASLVTPEWTFKAGDRMRFNEN